MMADIDYKTLADAKFRDWGELLGESGRMKEDADFFNMVSKTNKLLDANDSEIVNSVHVLLNDIATFTWEVETELNSAEERIEVLSENKRFDTAYVEEYIQTAFDEADKLLSNKGMFPFNSFIDQQSFRRGRVCSTCNFHFDGNLFIPDITYWDTGYVVVENDNRGISWIASKFWKSESQILSEYPEAENKTTSGKDMGILYILAKDTIQAWLNGAKIRDQKNTLGYVPAIYRRVPMGSMLQDKDTIRYQGESGIFLIRYLFKELERIASIIQSISLKAVDQALQIQRPPGESIGKAGGNQSVDELTAPGAVNETGEKSEYRLMPLGQLQAAFDRLYQMIQERMQRGTSRKYQNVLQPKTATEVMMEAQEQGNIILPRLNTRGLLKKNLAEMFIKQTIEACEKAKRQTFKLGNQDFDVSMLKGQYTIEFKYHFNDPRMDAARQSLATAQQGQRPQSWILRNTLMSEDPDEEDRQLAIEKARRENPLVSMDWEITKLLEAADEGDPYAEDAAMALAMVWIPAAKQAMQGLLTPNMPDELKPSQPVMSLQAQTPRMAT